MANKSDKNNKITKMLFQFRFRKLYIFFDPFVSNPHIYQKYFLNYNKNKNEKQKDLY